MAEKAESEPHLPAALTEQIALISLLVAFTGLVSTETYYAGFGVRYQVLEFPVQHLLYRGVTVLADSRPLIVVYFAAMVWLAIGARWFKERWPRAERFGQIASYSIIAVVVAVAYPFAIEAGRLAAERDIRSTTSTLPTVRFLRSSAGATLPHSGDRLLLAGNETVIMFRPTQHDAESPFVFLIRREALGEIVVSR